MKKHFKLFRHMKFAPVATTTDGVEDDIQTEQKEIDGRFNLEDGTDAAQLESFWNDVEADIQKDPEWFNFAEE